MAIFSLFTSQNPAFLSFHAQGGAMFCAEQSLMALTIAANTPLSSILPLLSLLSSVTCKIKPPLITLKGWHRWNGLARLDTSRVLLTGEGSVLYLMC